MIALRKTLQEGYSLALFKQDVFAGITVAIVALPLGLAIAIASNLSPEKGLYASLIGGFIISLFGGSKFQIGGAAGAFIVLIASIIERHGFDGLMTSTLMAGVIILLFGMLKLGRFIKQIPESVIAGFSAAIAIIIFLSQVKVILGVKTWDFNAINPTSLGLTLFGIAFLLLVHKLKPRLPHYILWSGVASLLVAVFALPVTTIFTEFGAIPSGLPRFSLPRMDVDFLWLMLPDAIKLAFLGAIESLLSAVVADKLSGDNHDSDAELKAQGVANIAATFFTSMTVTGTLARTATNIQAGAKSPVAGIIHSVVILLVLLFFTKLIGFLPLCALAAILTLVCWKMADIHGFIFLIKSSNISGAILLTTFLVTLLIDLLWGVAAGLLLSLLLKRFSLTKNI